MQAGDQCEEAQKQPSHTLTVCRLTQDGLGAQARVSTRRVSLERKQGKRSHVRHGWGPSELPPQRTPSHRKTQPFSLSSIAEEEDRSRTSVMQAVKKRMESDQMMTMDRLQRILDDEIIEAAAREYRCEQEKERLASKDHQKIQELTSTEHKSRSFRAVWPFKLPQLLTSTKVARVKPDVS